MIPDKDNIHPLLDRLVHARLTAAERERLAAYCVRTAADFTRLIARRHSYNFGRSGMSIEDIAADALGELLADDDEASCSALCSAISRKPGNGGSAAPLEAALHAVLYKTVQQNLPRIFAEADPHRGRILRSMRRAAHDDERIRTIIAGNGRWYCTAASDPRLQLPAVPYEHLTLFISTDGTSRKQIPDLLRTLLLWAERQTAFRGALNEHDLLQAIIENTARDFASFVDPDETPAEAYPDEQAAAAVEHAVKSALPWLEDKFIRPRKLTRAQAEAVLTACRSYMLDTAMDEASGFYSYLGRQIPGLTHAEYRMQWKNRCEYILRRLFSIAGRMLVKNE